MLACDHPRPYTLQNVMDAGAWRIYGEVLNEGHTGEAFIAPRTCVGGLWCLSAPSRTRWCERNQFSRAVGGRRRCTHTMRASEVSMVECRSAQHLIQETVSQARVGKVEVIFLFILFLFVERWWTCQRTFHDPSPNASHSVSVQRVLQSERWRLFHISCAAQNKQFWGNVSRVCLVVTSTETSTRA